MFSMSSTGSYISNQEAVSADMMGMRVYVWDMRRMRHWDGEADGKNWNTGPSGAKTKWLIGFLLWWVYGSFLKLWIVYSSFLINCVSGCSLQMTNEVLMTAFLFVSLLNSNAYWRKEVFLTGVCAKSEILLVLCRIFKAMRCSISLTVRVVAVASGYNARLMRLSISYFF